MSSGKKKNCLIEKDSCLNPLYKNGIAWFSQEELCSETRFLRSEPTVQQNQETSSLPNMDDSMHDTTSSRSEPAQGADPINEGTTTEG